MIDVSRTLEARDDVARLWCEFYERKSGADK